MGEIGSFVPLRAASKVWSGKTIKLVSRVNCADIDNGNQRIKGSSTKEFVVPGRRFTASETKEVHAHVSKRAVRRKGVFENNLYNPLLHSTMPNEEPPVTCDRAFLPPDSRADDCSLNSSFASVLDECKTTLHSACDDLLKSCSDVIRMENGSMNSSQSFDTFAFPSTASSVSSLGAINHTNDFFCFASHIAETSTKRTVTNDESLAFRKKGIRASRIVTRA